MCSTNGMEPTGDSCGDWHAPAPLEHEAIHRGSCGEYGNKTGEPDEAIRSGMHPESETRGHITVSTSPPKTTHIYFEDM
jgi:hypothetical protein